MDVKVRNLYHMFHIFILIATALTQLYAQTPDTLWTKTYGGNNYDYGESVQQTFDGGYIIAGFTYSFGAGADDVYLIKTDENGDTLWTKTYGGTGCDAGLSVQQTLDSGYIVVGGADLTPTTGMLYLLKTDHFGDTVWTKKFGDGGKEIGYSVQQTIDGGYVAAGYTLTFGPGYSAFYLVKTDPLGNLLWTKTYGGDNWDFGFSVQQTTDSSYIMCGFTTSFGAGGQDVYLVKTDAQGDTIWTKTYGGIGDDLGFAVIQTADGGYAITGYTAYGAGGVDVYVVKTNENGDTLWTKTYGGAQDDIGSSIRCIADGGYIIAGETHSFGAGSADAYIIKIDSNGDTLWTRIYGGTAYDLFGSVQQLTDFGYIVVGTTQSFGTDSSSVWLLKMEPDTIGIEEKQIQKLENLIIEVSPNPFREKTNIRYQIVDDSKINLTIYNATGRLVRQFDQTATELPDYIIWDGCDDTGKQLPNGIYFIKFKAGDCTETAKLLLIR